MYKNNRVCLLRGGRQRPPLRGEDLADDRVEAVAVLHGGEDGRTGAAHLERVTAHHVQVHADGRRESTLLTTRTSACVMPGPPLRGTLS